MQISKWYISPSFSTMTTSSVFLLLIGNETTISHKKREINSWRKREREEKEREQMSWRKRDSCLLFCKWVWELIEVILFCCVCLMLKSQHIRSLRHRSFAIDSVAIVIIPSFRYSFGFSSSPFHRPLFLCICYFNDMRCFHQDFNSMVR